MPTLNNIKIVLLFLILSALIIFTQGCQITQGRTSSESSTKSKIYNVAFEPSELTHLQTIVISGIDVKEAQASISSTAQLKLSIKVLSDTEQGLNDFFEHIQAQDNGYTLKINLFNNMVHYCHYEQVGSFIDVTGICVKDLKIELPQTSHVQVILSDIRDNKYTFKVQNGQILQERYCGETPEELISILKPMTFSDDQLPILATYIRHHPTGRIFYVREVEQILNSIFSERFTVARMLSERVIDPDNVPQLERFFFITEWQQIRDYLSQ